MSELSRPQQLEHRGVRLRPLLPSDFEFAYYVATAPTTGVTWRFRGVTPPHDMFARQLWDGVLCQYIVERVRDGRPVGIVTLYNVDLVARTAYCSAACVDDFVGTGLIIVGAALLLEHAFGLWSLTKVYFEIPEYNAVMLSSAITKWGQEEACFRKHEYLWGRHWDLRVFALYRDRWTEVARSLLRRRPSSYQSASVPSREAFVDALRADGFRPTMDTPVEVLAHVPGGLERLNQVLFQYTSNLAVGHFQPDDHLSDVYRRLAEHAVEERLPT